MAKSDRVIRFIEMLTNTKGPAAGTPFLLRDWQKDIVRGIYDPQTEDNRRRVRHALITMPRKNGKTELAAGLVLYHLLADGEINGEVYSAAANRDQAAHIFNAAAAMIRADPDLSSLVNIIESQKRIVHYASGSYYKALSSDAKSKHGFNASCIVYDELAQAPNRELYDVLVTSTSARAQPLTVVISTTSSNPSSVMSELVDYGRKVKDGVIEDPTFYPVIYQAPLDAILGMRTHGLPAILPWVISDRLKRCGNGPRRPNTFPQSNHRFAISISISRWTLTSAFYLPGIGTPVRLLLTLKP